MNALHKVYKFYFNESNQTFCPQNADCDHFLLCLVTPKGLLSHSTWVHKDRILTYLGALSSFPYRDRVSHSLDFKRWYRFPKCFHMQMQLTFKIYCVNCSKWLKNINPGSSTPTMKTSFFFFTMGSITISTSNTL